MRNRTGMLSLLVVMGLAGCGVSIPRSVLERPRFTTFEPTGKWYVTGNSVAKPEAKWQAEVTVSPIGGIWYKIERSNRPNADDFGIVDGETLVIAYRKGKGRSEDEQRYLSLLTELRDYNNYRNIIGAAPGALGYEKWAPYNYRIGIDGFQADRGSYEGMVVIEKLNEKEKGSPMFARWEFGNVNHCGVGLQVGRDQTVLTSGRCVKIDASIVASETKGLGSSEQRTTTTWRIKETTLEGAWVIEAMTRTGDNLEGKRASMWIDQKDNMSYRVDDEVWSRTPPTAP